MDSINVSGKECEVEQLPRSMHKGSPTHDLVAPQGFRFDSCGHHSIPCFGLRDLKQRAASEALIECPADCDCHDD